jgi:protoheme IX farnesyltransferase
VKTAVVCADAPPLVRTRFADYLELTKPRIAVLVLFTVAIGFILAAGSAINWLMLFHTVFGTALVAAGASALNQYLERRSDALMHRTENRPLPAGRLLPIEVLSFGLSLGIGGVAYLAVTLLQVWTPLLAAVTFLSYVFIYTPLKRTTTFNTLIGAVPGALPPVIGWVAVRGSLGPEVLIVFLVLFLWQIPHFLAIAWIYREDYALAGLKMLPVSDRHGWATGRSMISYCVALLTVSVAPVVFGWSGVLYLLGAIVLGGGFLLSAVAFARRRSLLRARGVLRASLIYLPALLALLILDGWW